MHDVPPPAPLMPLTPLSRMLAVCAIDGKQAAVQLTASLTSPQRRTLHQEAAAAGFESLVTSILGESDVLAEARGRIERFRFSQHLNAVWTMAGLLAAQGIRVLILKGAALALRRYAVPPFLQPWMRPAGDIDLFVEPSSMERAFGILESAGLVCADRGGKPDFSTSHAITLTGRRLGRFAGLWIELHAHLSHSPWREHLEFGPLFWRGEVWKPPMTPMPMAENVPAARGTLIRLLSDEDETVFLASHGAGHRFAHPKWLLDMALALSAIRTAEQWERIQRVAEETGCASALSLSVEIVNSALAAVNDAETPRAQSSEVPWRKPPSPAQTWRRLAFRTACGLTDSAALTRGALTCLALTDAFSPGQIRPLAALALSKIQQHRAARLTPPVEAK